MNHDEGASSSSSPGQPAGVPLWSPRKVRRIANKGLEPPVIDTKADQFPDLATASAANVLQWHCQWHLDSGKVPVGSAGRRRKVGKGPPSLHSLLQDLSKDPSKALTKEAGWEANRAAGHYMAKIVVFHKQVPLREARASLVRPWKEASEAFKANVFLLAQHLEIEGQAGPDAVVLADQRDVECHGVLLTWHTHWGRDGDYVADVFKNCDNMDDMANLLKVHEPLEDGFVRFTTWVSTLAESHGFKYWCCAMELNEPDSPKARVHLHTFMSLDWRHWKTPRFERVLLCRDVLKWDGFSPHIVPTQTFGRQNPRRGLTEGLYYCIAPKIGSVFREGNFSLWKDTRPVARWGLHRGCCGDKVGRWGGELAGGRIEWEQSGRGRPELGPECASRGWCWLPPPSQVSQWEPFGEVRPGLSAPAVGATGPCGVGMAGLRASTAFRSCGCAAMRANGAAQSPAKQRIEEGWVGGRPRVTRRPSWVKWGPFGLGGV